jgi:hypothetical protein
MKRFAFLFLFTFIGCQSPSPQPIPNTTPATTPAVPIEKSIGLLPEISSFLFEHKEFGEAIQTQPIPDWAKGKRQRVEFDFGGTRRNLLFYTKDNKVVTIYEDTSDGRKKVWGEGE